MFEDDAKALLLRAMRNNGIEMPASNRPYQVEVNEQLIRVVRTPREIKRMIVTAEALPRIASLLVGIWSTTVTTPRRSPSRKKLP